MQTILNPAVIWFLLGLIFLLLEFVVPGLILFFFAVGAWLVALLCLVSDPSINFQLIVFIGTSVVTILLFRKWVKNLLWQGKHSTELLQDEFLGKTAKAETAISPGEKGKIDFKGTSWDACSEDVIAAGESVIITGNESILLMVKSAKL